MENTTIDQQASRKTGKPARRFVIFTPPHATPAIAAFFRADALATGPLGPVDYASLYAGLQTTGAIPNASVELIDQNHAVFQGMYLDLGVIKQKLATSGLNPPVVTVYADVLVVPDGLKWSLASAGLVVFARRIEVGSTVQVFLDFRASQAARFVLFSTEVIGSFDTLSVVTGQAAPVIFPVEGPLATPGLMISWKGSAPGTTELTQGNGLALPVTELFTQALDTSFIFGSLLYDQNPTLALAIFTWVKSWAGESSELCGLFLRSSSMVALLSSQIDAKANGASFVPYLTAAVYEQLAAAFVGEAKQYEADYMQLRAQKVLTDENIELARTLADNAQYQSAFVQALKKQAQSNYENAKAAVATAKNNLRLQQLATKLVAADFEQVGLPEYERKKVAEAVFSLATSIVTFGAAIAAMVFGQEEAAPAAAASAAGAAESVAEAAGTAAETAKMASALAEQMKTLKKLVEALGKVYELSQAVMEAASNIKDAGSMVSTMKEMDVETGGIDLSATDQWQIFQLKSDAVLQVAVDADIGYAADYKQALDIMVIYGQSLAGAQLAAIQAGQQYARVLLQEQLAAQQRARLDAYVASLKAGEAPIAALMQQLYQRYLDSKGSLLAAVESYRASYAYWALAPSSVRPRIIDPVSTINTGLDNLTSIALDAATALSSFDPAPATITDKQCIIDDPATLAALSKNGTASWTIELDNESFLGLDRVRLTTVRVWLEGAKVKNGQAVSVLISTSGTYRDRLNGTEYLFTAKPLKRGFEYHVAPAAGAKPHPDWKFEDGNLGYIELDGSVAAEVSYAYFQPTPFSEWTIALGPSDNPGLDLSKVTRITMQFQGSGIYTSTVT